MIREEAANRLNAVSVRLCNHYNNLAAVEEAALNARHAAHDSHRGSDIGVTELRWEIDFAAIDHQRAIINTKADIAIAEEERDNLRFLIKHGLIESI